MESDAITVLIRSEALPDCIEQARADLLALAAVVRERESECLSIEVAQDLDDGRKITMIEKWVSREAYEGAHLTSDHMQAFVAKSAELFAGPPQISFCRAEPVGESGR